MASQKELQAAVDADIPLVVGGKDFRVTGEYLEDGEWKTDFVVFMGQGTGSSIEVLVP